MGLKKYIITGHVIEVYEYKNYIHGKGGARVRGEASEENKQKNYSNTKPKTP